MQSQEMRQNQRINSVVPSIRKAVWALAVALAVMSTASRTSAEVQVWTSDVTSGDWSTNVLKSLKPVNIVGARNGTFSGKMVVESTTALTGVKASVGALTGMGSTIPAQNVQLRYGVVWGNKDFREFRCCATPRDADILLDAPTDVPPVYRRALMTVWVTVKVPRDAKAGKYTGQLTVCGHSVPLNLDVQNWTLPDPQNYRTLVDFVQSPDTLALEYNVPLWSEQHWKLIARSFQLLSDTGGRTLYVPLICRSNFGNEQSMVRWIAKGGNKYEYDYTVLDKYLDTAEKNLGKPKLVVFVVWDICMSEKSLQRGLWDKNDATGKSRADLLGKGPRVTALNPTTKEVSMLTLPRYEDAESTELWTPMFAEIRKRMEKRGLDQSMMLGLMPDLWPTKEEVSFWKDVSGGLPWVIHGHEGTAKDVMIGNKGLYKIADIGYAAFVYNARFNVNPDKERMYGWRAPGLLSCYWRNGALNSFEVSVVREFPSFNITGGQRGCGRIGADSWPAMRNHKGERSGHVYARYPENNWRNLDIGDFFLAPGPDSPVGTARLESLKEGMQECEARIFLEDAFLDDAKKAKIGLDLAKRCQDALDEHQHAMWKTIWSNDEDLKSLGALCDGYRNPPEALWQALKKTGKKLGSYEGDPVMINMQAEERRKGQEWFSIGYQDREKKLFSLAGEVAAKLNLPR